MGATINIKSSNGTTKHSAVYEESSVRKFELMKEDYVRLVFSTDSQFVLSLGDYIDTDWGTFYITKPQKPTQNLTTGGYDYDIQFDAPHYRWNNKLYKFEPDTNRNEANWSLTDNLENHMAVFLRNLEHHGWEYTVDQSSYLLESASRNVYIQFDSCYLLDALTKIAEAFGVEWWITDDVIHFGKAETGTIVDFEIGVNVEQMGAENGNKDYFTRLYAFGSTRNIPSGYRSNDEQVLLNGVVQKRLMLPAETPYVDVEDDLTDDEVVEGIVIFEDVYPHLDNSITNIRSDEREVEKTDTVETGDGESSDESETETVTIYRFKDSGLTFSSEYLLPGQQLQVQFQSGDLSGMIFDLTFNPDNASEDTDDGQWFEIVRNETYGLMLPNDTLKPARNDRFILLGWNVTKIEDGLGLISDAEDELLDRITEYAADFQKDSNVYPCTMMSDYMFGLDNSGNQDSTKSKVGTFPLGQRVRLNNDNFFVGGSRVSRVVGYEYKLDLPYDGAIIYVGESATYSSKQAAETKVNDAMDAINYRGGEFSRSSSRSNIYIITTNDTTTPTDSNAFSALKSDRRFARKDVDDKISSLWTFNNGHGARRGIQTHEYGGSGANEDNIFGHGFELVEKTDSNGNRKSRLEVDELFVRIKAFFASLEIREISYLGGNYAFSSAGSKIYHVEWLNGLGVVLPKIAANISSIAKFRCYLYSDDGTTATTNKWAANDQIMCQTFNLDEDVYENKSNKYYWRRCIGIGKSAITGDDSETEYQYVDISMSDCATGSDYPEDEDTIVQFGNWTNAARQGLIYLKVEGEGSPAIIEYSGVGANGNHFVLPSPSLQLSPNRNIIYGEFHSIVNSSDDKEGEGDTIDDKLTALLNAINDVKNQADQRFDIWFGSGAPLPNEDEPDEDANYPASEWTTNALKALHAQDLFYDTQREPASDGGRAWRWTAYEGEDEEVHYQWMEVTDADTVASLEKISDVASDGKLTGGAEKTRVAIEWQKAVDDYWEYKERAEDYEITTEWTAYHNAFVALGKLLNGGTTLTKNQGGAWNTPSWLSDLLSTTTITNADDYREAWNDYYASLTALLQAITAKAKELADAAQETANSAVSRIEAIASDNKIEKSELPDIRREFVSALHEFWDEGGLLDQALKGNTYVNEKVESLCDDTEDALKAIGTFLNSGTNWTYITVIGTATVGGQTVTTYELDWLQTLANLPLWLKSTYTYTGPIDIDGDDFIELWGTYYACRSAILGALSEAAHDAADSADNKAQNALSELQDIASDGVISPSEKNILLLKWLEVANEYPILISQANKFANEANSSDLNSAIISKKGVYVNKFQQLANYLNNGTYNVTLSQTLGFEGFPLPLWLNSTNLGTKVTLTTSQKAAYNTVWEEYFTARTSLQELIAEASKEPGNDALGELDNLADDDVLTEYEKLTVLREWATVASEKSDLINKANKSHVSYSSYESAYNTLGNYLNNPSQSHPNTTAFTGTPQALTTSGNTSIDGDTFKAYWSALYAARTALLSAISTSKVGYYVSVNVPTPPYYVGDLWMKLANTSDTRGKMFTCVVKNETSTGLETDWADLSEITRDPFVLLAKVASKVYDLNGDNIQSRGSVDFVVARTSTTGQKGDILYNASNNKVYTYDNGWSEITNSTINSLGYTLYSIIGVHTYKIYNTESTSASKYDMCVRNISFTDPFSLNTIDGNLNILVYSDGNWLTMQDSAKSMIENFADQLNSYMFASENGFIKSSGLVTRTNISELFAQVNDPDSGEIITKSYLQVYTSDFVNENGVREIISGVDISADKINLTGSDRISMLVKNSVKNIVNANLITNSLIGETSTVYGFANRSVRLTSGTIYTLSANGIVPSGAHANNMVLKIFIWRMADAIDVEENPERIEGQTWMNSAVLTIEYNNGAAQTKYVNLTADRTCEYHIKAYMYYTLGTDSTTNAGGTRTVGVTLNWMKLEKGQTATEWIAGVGDEILWKNYIGNPRAVDGTFDTYTSGSQTLSHCSKVTDPSFGEVVAITHDSNSSWQLRFTAISEYTNLTGKAATFFVICKNMGSNDDGSQLRFGGGEENVSALDTRTADFIDLGDGWRKYYATKYIATGLMNSNSGTNTGNIGINCVIGTWRVYAVGVVLGGVCPTTQDIMNQSGLIATGIDIQKRIIELRADKVRFTSSDGTITNKVSIDPTTGTLRAYDGEFSGKINLYDSNNDGITVYDEEDIARVSIKSDTIGNIAQMANDTWTILNASSSIATTSYNNTVTSSSIGTLVSNKTIEVENVLVFLSGGNSTFPSTNSALLKIEILNGSTVVATKNITIEKFNLGQYKGTEGFRYTVKTNGTYYIRYTVSGISTTASSPVYISISARVQTSDVVQTLIGADGLYSHIGANKLLWFSDKELQLRFGFGGLRMSYPNENAIQGVLDTIAGVHGTMPNYKPTWLPFHNIMPCVVPQSFEQKQIVNIGQNKRCYKIDPQTFRGILILDQAAIDFSTLNAVETWIELPETTFTQDGAVCSLPVGYTVTIIKNFTGADLYVVPHSSQKNGAIIVDANQNNNYYVGMNSNGQTRETFVFVDGYGEYTGRTWISFRDH